MTVVIILMNVIYGVRCKRTKWRSLPNFYDVYLMETCHIRVLKVTRGSFSWRRKDPILVRRAQENRGKSDLSPVVRSAFSAMSSYVGFVVLLRDCVSLRDYLEDFLHLKWQVSARVAAPHPARQNKPEVEENYKMTSFSDGIWIKQKWN